MPSYNYTNPQGQSFTLDVDEELQPDQVYQRFVDAGVAQAQAPQATTDAGYLSQLGSALSIGAGQMASGVKATFNAATGDIPDTAAAMAQMGALQKEQQANLSAEDIALNEAFARNKAEYDQARGILPTIGALSGYVGSIASQPGAAFKQAIQSAPNAAISAGTGLAGYALGGLLGAGAGIETGPGAVLTGIAGAAAGGAISNSLMEAGPAIYDILNERTNGAASSMTADQITQVLQQNPDIMSEGLKTGAIRGSVIGVIEGLGMKGAGRLMSIPERAAARAVQKTLIGAGVDVASKEAVESALLDPALKNAVSAAAKTAQNEFTSAGNLARLAGASGIEIGASGAGEVGAQVATGQEIDPTAAVQEMMGEVGLSIPVAAVAKGLELARTPQALQTPIQQALAREINAIPTNAVPPQTEEEKQAGAEAGNPIFVDPQGNTAAVAPEMWNEAIKRQITPPVEAQAATQSSDVEARLANLMRNPGLTAAVNTADSIVTTAENTSSDVSQATTAARNIIQGVVDTPQPQVAPAELPAVTPSPAMEQTENLSQTITDSNGEIAPEMSVLPPTAEAGAGVGEAIAEDGQLEPSTSIEDQKEALKDIIALKKGRGQDVAELESKLQSLGADTIPDFVEVNPETPLHPFTSEKPLLPIKVEVSDAGVRSIDSSVKQIEKLRKSLNGKLARASGANKFSIESDIYAADKALQELGRVGREIESYLKPITPQGTPTPATEGTVMPGGSAMERDVTKALRGVNAIAAGLGNNFPDPLGPVTKFVYDKATGRDTNEPAQMTPEEYSTSSQLSSSQVADEEFIKELVRVGKKEPSGTITVTGSQLQKAKTKTGAFSVENMDNAAGVVTPVLPGKQYIVQPRDGYNQGFHRGQLTAATRSQKPVSAVAVDSYGITLPEGYVKQGDLYVFSPQTTTVATPTETAAPLAKEAAVASVVQQPAEGSIPAVEQESATTAIESNEKADIADAAMAFLEEDLTESKRQWSPEKIAAAKAYFASGGKDMDVLRAAFPKLVGSRPIVQAYLKADKDASEAQAKRDAADAKLAKEIERDEKEQAKAEAAQKKRDELNLKTLNSLIQKTRTNVVQGTVKPTDANQAVAILNRSGEIPNVLFTWIGTSKDFLADPANRARYPETWKAVSSNPNIEGMSENGQPIVFTDNVGVSDLDRNLAKLQGTTPEVAAVRRVILHENIHKGMFFLSLKDKMKLFQFLHRLYSPEELDQLAKSYDEYSDWRINQVSYFSIIEEAMTRDFDSMAEIPRDGIWAEFMQFLRDIWQKITGKTSEPTLKDYKDVFRLIRNSLKNSEAANADRLKNGGEVRMSMSEFISNVTPEQDAAYAKAVADGDMATAQRMADEAQEKAVFRTMVNPDLLEPSEEIRTPQVVQNIKESYNVNESDIDWSEQPAIIATQDNVIRDGHHRHAAWRDLGFTNIPVIYVPLEAWEKVAGNGNVDPLIRWASDLLGDYVTGYQPNITSAVGVDFSADPVTYDNAGNIIPLSRRFQSASNDIRFSKVEYDSPNDAAFNSGAEVARNTDYDERDKEVRSTIRAAYDIAPKTNGPSVPLDELFSIVQQSMPDVTETEFSRILQGLYEDSGALLIEGESPFATFTTEGERAGSAIIMPPTDMTKDNVISMLRGMSAANPVPSGGINQELYDTVLTRLRDFISNGGRIPLPIQLDRSGEANMDNYTGKKAGLGGGLRQGSGVGRAGQTDSGTPLFDGLPEGVQGVIPQAQRVESEVSRNREAIAGRGENREGKAGARPDMGMASGGYTFADYAQIASRIGARVQEVSNDIGGGLAVMADENGATTILINAAQLSERMAGISFGLDEDGAIETIGNALVEELIHAADLAVQREAWLASGRRKPFTEFAIDSDKSMLDEMREVVASSNDPVKATQILHDAIQASRQLYGAGATPSDIDELFSSPKGNISSVMSEFVRQMIQQDMHQTVSEASLFRRFIERVMKMLQKIRDAIAPAKAGEFGDILKNRINETEMMLAMAYQQTGARASMIDPEDAATKQFAKNIKDINSGTAKAAFDGVQFVDFEPVDHIVKPNKSYEQVAIDYVNSFIAGGGTLEQMANSVISPDFLSSIGIEDDVKARQALVAEVKNRIVNTRSKKKSKVEKKFFERLNNRVSSFWQGLGTKSGGNQGQRAYIIGNPRYSWMFLSDEVEKDLKERRDNILNVQFGNDNATSFTQNSYENSDKANQQAADEIAQDAVNNDEWALIKEGEQVFEGGDKTLWERAKALVRRFAFYARAEAAEKVSASKASMTDAERNELNAILTMPKAEREKAKAKDLAEFRSIMGKLLGDESPTDTPTEKKKRKKRKEIIDTVEKRVAEGQPIEPTAEEIANEIEIAENKASQIVYRFEELYRQGFKNPPEGMSKKEQKDSIIRAFRDQVKNPVSFEQFAERLDALKVGEEVSERLFLTAFRERADLARMKKFKIEKRRVEIADKQASRLIYSTEERLRQGSKDLSKSTSGDSINKAFKDQVSDPVDKSKFAERLAKLDVSPDVAERLFKTAEREKTDLEAMAAFNILQGPKALQRMINEINNMRRGEEIPLRTPIPWRQLLSQSAKTVDEYRQRIFDAISANESLENATPEQKARLAELFTEAWETKRKRILDSMQERLIREQEAKGNLSKKAAEALQENRMRIVEDINLGIFDNDEIAKIIAEKFGIKSEFTDEERQKIESLIAILQDETLNRVKRNKAAYELLETLSAQTDISIAKLLSNFWVSSVLSGMNTVFSIGMSVFSGMGELTTALSRIFSAAFSNPKQLSSEVAAAFKTLARVLSAVPRQANRAWQYLVTGDQAFLDPSMNDALKNMDYASIGKNNQLAEQMAKSDKILEKSMGLFMRTISRLLNALDLFNSGLTKEGSLSIVFRQLDLDPAKIQMLEKKSDLKAYKDQVIRDYFNNVQPKTLNEKALVDSYAMAEMMKALDEIGKVSENADQMAMQGAMTLDPSGLGGYGYRFVKSMMKSAESGTDELLERNLRKWDEAVGVDEKAEAGVKLVFSYIFQFAAYNAANLVGVRFARFAGNKFNQSLSFLPLIGTLRLYEKEFDSDRIRGKEAFTDMIKRNQITGVIAAVIGYYVLKAIAEEPDDEKRGAFINGGWSNLTPEKKQQKIASGQKEYTLGFGDTVINYGNWPGSGILAAIGGLSDLIRFSPDQWNDKTVANKLLSATTSGVFSAMEVPALSQFQELFGSSLSSKDPNEQKLTKFARVIGNYVGGFVPRILKDIDYIFDPNFRKYETLWEKTASHIPVYRRYEGKEYYDILGQQIQRNVYPGSREFMVKPTDPAYKVLGALNSRGIWLTPANAEHRMVGKGARRRSLTQEEADNYSLETGKGYKQMLLRYGQRALQMPTERAKAFLLDKANEVRDRALKKVYRGYQPAT